MKFIGRGKFSRFFYIAIAAIIVLYMLMRGWFVLFDNSLGLKVNIEPYRNAELKPTDKQSRIWMDYAIELEKQKNFAPALAARLYAYVAGVFSDVLDAGGSSEQASAATALILQDLIPDKKSDIGRFYTLVYEHTPTATGTALTILNTYRDRIAADKHELVWSDSMLPDSPDAWYPRGGQHDGGAMSGEWKTWILDGDFQNQVPPPPVRGSTEDQLDQLIVSYATKLRSPVDLSTIYFWQGASGAVKGQNNDNISPAGVWQNILFMEKSAELDEKQYAHAQKILAQSIADSFIYCWRVKYQYYVQRPSMRDTSLELALADPPFPAYVSGHSTISKAAAVVLSAMYPDKQDIWEANASDARSSRLLAGIHFDSDNAAGAQFGQLLGEHIVSKLNLGTYRSVGNTGKKGGLWPQMEIWLLGAHDVLTSVSLEGLIQRLRAHFSTIHVQEVSKEAGLAVQGPSYAAWGDYNADGRDDLVSGGVLYKNIGDGTFANVTAQVGLAQALVSATNVIFADYNNDGCEDLLILHTREPKLSLYRNDCQGKFVDATGISGLADEAIPMGAAFGDYNNDGLLDLYIANFPIPLLRTDLSDNNAIGSLYDHESRTIPGAVLRSLLTVLDNALLSRYGSTERNRLIFTAENTSPVLPLNDEKDANILFRNDGRGHFTNVTFAAGTSGHAKCPQYPPLDYHALQPIWFDYNRDGKEDLFVATDLWVSPLYRNNGDGTFTDVTETAGMCLPGTGMGISVTDLDHNGYPDLYVTNVGSNYLWMNQGNETFKEEAVVRGVADDALGWGTNFADLNNDGSKDLVVVNGTIVGFQSPDINGVHFNLRNLDEIYENNGSGYFYPVGAHAGLMGSQFKQPSAVADYNADGYLDIYVGAEGHGSTTYNPLYKNTGGSNHWLELRLHGTKSNRDAVGAKLQVTSGGKVQTSELINNASYFAQDSRIQHFGLGANTKADVEINWPSGMKQSLPNVSVDQVLEVTEP